MLEQVLDRIKSEWTHVKAFSTLFITLTICCSTLAGWGVSLFQADRYAKLLETKDATIDLKDSQISALEKEKENFERANPAQQIKEVSIFISQLREFASRYDNMDQNERGSEWINGFIERKELVVSNLYKSGARFSKKISGMIQSSSDLKALADELERMSKELKD